MERVELLTNVEEIVHCTYVSLWRTSIVADPPVIDQIATLESEALIDIALLLGLVTHVVAIRVHCGRNALTQAEGSLSNVPFSVEYKWIVTAHLGVIKVRWSKIDST